MGNLLKTGLSECVLATSIWWKRRSWSAFSGHDDGKTGCVAAFTKVLLVVATILGVWIASLEYAAREQDQAVALITREGGQVIYEHQLDAQNRLTTKRERPGPAWLRRLLGDGWFYTPVAVDFIRQKVDVRRSVVFEIAKLRSLRRLGLRGRDVTDVTIGAVLHLRSLETLTLCQTSATDEGMAFLAHARNLRHLSVDSPFVTDESIDSLETMDHLATLCLLNTCITDQGLRRLRQRLGKTDVNSSVPIDVMRRISSRLERLRPGMSQRQIWATLGFDPTEYEVTHTGGGGSLGAMKSFYTLRGNTILLLEYDLRNPARRWVFSKAELTTRRTTGG